MRVLLALNIYPRPHCARGVDQHYRQLAVDAKINLNPRVRYSLLLDMVPTARPQVLKYRTHFRTIERALHRQKRDTGTVSSVTGKSKDR